MRAKWDQPREERGRDFEERRRHSEVASSCASFCENGITLDSIDGLALQDAALFAPDFEQDALRRPERTTAFVDGPLRARTPPRLFDTYDRVLCRSSLPGWSVPSPLVPPETD